MHVEELSKRTSSTMKIAKFMMLFHFFFLVFGMLTLILMARNIISFDWSAFLIIVITILFNALFGILWSDDVKKKRVHEQEMPKPPQEPVRTTPDLGRVYPAISFVVPAFNQERNIRQCINSLFECALSYHGSSEILIVDDGSTDTTFEIAWTTVNSKQRESAHIRAKVVKHMANLGKAEALKTGVNTAMGEYVAIVDIAASCDSAWLTEIMDYIYTSEKTADSSYLPSSRKAASTFLNMSGIHRAETLRRLLNENQNKVIPWNSRSHAAKHPKI